MADEKSARPEAEGPSTSQDKNATSPAPDKKCAVKPKADNVEHGSNSTPVNNPKRVCAVLSASFLLVFTANVSLQNLQSSLNKKGGLGLVSLAVLYGAMLVCAPLSPLIIRGLNAKRTLMMAWITHVLYTLSNFYPTFATLLPASFLLGAASGPMWTAQGLYISASSMDFVATSKMGMHEALSKFNGFFFACYESTQIVGNVLASLVLMQGTYNTSDHGVPSCGADYCLESEGNYTSHFEQPEQKILFILMGMFLACVIVGLILTIIWLPVPNSRAVASEIDISIKESTTSCLSMLMVPRMLLLLPFFMAQSMNNGILLSGYTESFVSCAHGVQWVGYVMTAYGVLTVAQALGMNTLFARYLGRYVMLAIAGVADTSTAITMLLWNPVGSSVALFFILPCVSGIAEGVMQAQLSSLIAMVFPNNITGAFLRLPHSQSHWLHSHFPPRSLLLPARTHLRVDVFVRCRLPGLHHRGVHGGHPEQEETRHQRRQRPCQGSRHGGQSRENCRRSKSTQRNRIY
ncbi:protein unc-93 homolog A-like isoform X2 [Pomacea canaliculata]|nr:protein unc-93 homolog A-like isoform X2 [Pomacea canaliculata]